MLGVTDQDLRRSEAWLDKRLRLAGVIRAVVAGPPPQAHRRSRGRGGHLARPRRGAVADVCAVIVLLTGIQGKSEYYYGTWYLRVSTSLR